MSSHGSAGAAALVLAATLCPAQDDAALARARRLIATLDLPEYHLDVAAGIGAAGAAAIPELQALLDAGSRTRALGAVHALLAMPAEGRQVVPMLHAAFARRPGLRAPTQQRWVEYLLGQLATDEQALDILVGFLGKSGDARLGFGLGTCARRARVLDGLAPLLYGKDGAARRAAIQVLLVMAGPHLQQRRGDGLYDAVETFLDTGKDTGLRELIGESTQGQKGAAEAVLALCQKVDGIYRGQAARARPPQPPPVAELPEPAEPPSSRADPQRHAARLVAMLDLEPVGDRAVRELAALGEPAFDAVRGALGDADQTVAFGAVKALRAMDHGPPDRFALLLRFAGDEAKPDAARLACVDWLSGQKAERHAVLNAFEALLRSRSIPVVTRVVGCLGELGAGGDERAAMILLRGLRHPSVDVQVATVFALGRTAAENHLVRLRGAADLAEPVRQAVELALEGKHVVGFLICDYSDNRVIQVDLQGRKVRSLEDIFGVWDAELLANGNWLLTEFSVNRVSEVTPAGKSVWAFDRLKNPYDADRLPDGNTLIADTFGRRVIEVDKAGAIVWTYDKAIHPYDADRLPDGNTLIADTQADRVIEVSREGKIVWQVPNVPNVHDADRLPDGNTLLTIRMLNEVREVDREGKVVMTLQRLNSPSDADRLPDGRTLVAENGKVRIFDRAGVEVWSMGATWAVEANPVFGCKPDAPVPQKAGTERR